MEEKTMREVLTENGKNNKGKTFRKTPYKKKIIKYIALEKPLSDKLEQVSKSSGLSQSYVMAIALIEYFKSYNLYK